MMRIKLFIIIMSLVYVAAGCSSEVRNGTSTLDEPTSNMPTNTPTQGVVITPSGQISTSPQITQTPHKEDEGRDFGNVSFYQGTGELLDCSECYEIEYNTKEFKEYVPEPLYDTAVKENSIRLMFGDDELWFEHSKTSVAQYEQYVVHKYMNRDLFTTVAYYAEAGGKITFGGVLLGEYEYFLTEVPITSEKQLLDLCNRQWGELGISVSAYVPEIETQVSYKSHMDKLEGFNVPTGEDVRNVTYDITYRRYINGIKTNDLLSINVGVDGKLESLLFQRPYTDLSSYGSSIVDDQMIGALVDDTVKYMCNIEGYELKSYSVDESLIVLDGKLVMQCYVKPEFASEGSDHMHTKPIYLLVPIETAD